MGRFAVGCVAAAISVLAAAAEAEDVLSAVVALPRIDSQSSKQALQNSDTGLSCDLHVFAAR